MPDTWDDGAAYERFIGRWSRRVAPLFLDWLDLPPGLRWAELGCGAGALTAAVLERCSPASVVGVDPSAAFVEAARAAVDDPRVELRVGTSPDLAPGSADVAVSGLVMHFVPEPLPAVRDLAAAASGGTVAAYVWDYAGGMQMLHRFWEVAGSLDPAVGPLDEAARFPICREGALAEVWREAGLVDVRSTGLTVPMHFTGFADYWEPFLGGQGPAPTYVATLPPDRRDALRDALRQRLPDSGEGPIDLTARAWAVTGRAT